MKNPPCESRQGVNSERGAAWKTLQQMALRYKVLQKDSAERAALREQIARHLAGVFVHCVVEDEPSVGCVAQGQPKVGRITRLAEKPDLAPESGARLMRRDSLLESMFREVLYSHAKKSAGGFALPDAHGGVSAFTPPAAQGFVEERHHRARDATCIEALFHGWDPSKGTLQGFMRQCVRSFLADMARARKPEVRDTGPRIPNDASPEERAQSVARFEERKRRLRGEALPLEEQNPLPRSLTGEAGEGDDEDSETYDADDEMQHRVREWVETGLKDESLLAQAIIRQWMGWDEELNGEELAVRFGVSPARVSQIRKEITKRLQKVFGS